ncbi:hypothetical protein GCM10025876_06330 [Demequina litorisediminis]|uniref:Orc1-like AAA ATPase domain-containing protein n=1 Tax=Demequina litorisediminis TaxID=1849022 RepID=A0ABQ6I9X7_9MICO|nr:hypothetical protein GCM10025876_06330 [Demequina litorisediminis]
MTTTPQAPETQEQSALEQFGQDFTALAEAGSLDPVIGRDEEIRRVMQVLTRRTKNNAVLIGEPGVGKTAIVEGLAQRIVAGDVPSSLKDRRVIEIAMRLGRRGRRLPRPVRGAPQGHPRGGRGGRGAHRALRRRAPHHRGRGQGRRLRGRRQHPQADARARQACA